MSAKALSSSPLRLDDAFQFIGDLRDPLSELGGSRFPVFDVGRSVVEEFVQRLDQVCFDGDVDIQRLLFVLEQDGALRRLEQDVLERVARFALLVYRFVEVVMDVFRFPVGEDDARFVQRGSVDGDVAAAAFHTKFALESGVHLFCAVLHERVERSADGAFLVGAVRVQVVHVGVVILDRLMRREQVQFWHGHVYSASRGRGQAAPLSRHSRLRGNDYRRRGRFWVNR